MKGVSDILGCLPDGRLLAIEVKKHNGRVRQEQQRFVYSINQRGGLAMVARSLDEVKERLACYVKSPQP